MVNLGKLQERFNSIIETGTPQQRLFAIEFTSTCLRETLQELDKLKVEIILGEGLDVFFNGEPQPQTILVDSPVPR